MRFSALLSIAFLTACGSSPFPITSNLEPAPAPFLDTCDEAAEATYPDSLTVEAAEAHGSTLLVQYSHGGGCETHEYAVCFVDRVLASDPPQFELRILHNANGDTCRAFKEEVLSVELPREFRVTGLRPTSVLLQ